MTNKHERTTSRYVLHIRLSLHSSYPSVFEHLTDLRSRFLVHRNSWRRIRIIFRRRSVVDGHDIFAVSSVSDGRLVFRKGRDEKTDNFFVCTIY